MEGEDWQAEDQALGEAVFVFAESLGWGAVEDRLNAGIVVQDWVLMCGGVGAALGEAGGAIAGFGDGIDHLADFYLVGVVEDGRLAAGKVHFDFVDAGMGLEGFFDGLLAAMAVHSLDFNEDKLVAMCVGHWSRSTQFDITQSICETGGWDNKKLARVVRASLTAVAATAATFWGMHAGGLEHVGAIWGGFSGKREKMGMQAWTLF
jgi:hypothetical protein